MDTRIMSRLTLVEKLNIDAQLQQFKLAIIDEVGLAFNEIIQRYGEEGLYSLALYHDGNFTRNFIISFSTEKGLLASATRYAKHSPMGIAEHQCMLRWSEGDSPYHEIYPELEKTELARSELESIVGDAVKAVGEYDFDIELELHKEFSRRMEATAVQALEQVAQQTDITAFVQSNGCTISLSAWDIDGRHMLNSIESVLGVAERNKVEKQIQDAHELNERHWELTEAERLKSAPIVTSLKVSDFQDVIDRFNPVFIEKDGNVFIDDKCISIVNSHLNSSRYEYQTNRFCLMELLKDNAHFDEMDKLFGHFRGPQFNVDDLLPCIARALVLKLADLLVAQFPEHAFYTYMEVDRFSGSSFRFFHNRQDGMTGQAKTGAFLGEGNGVKECRVVGPVASTVKVQAGLYRSEGHYVAHAFACYNHKLFTDLTDHASELICTSALSYEEAVVRLKRALQDHFDNGFYHDFMNFYVFEYFTEVFDGLDRFEMIEFQPAFIREFLVE